MKRRPLDESNDPNFARPPLPFADKEAYVKQMRNMFGDTKLPAVLYKGETIPSRHL